MTQLRLSIPSWFSRLACWRELFHKKSKKSSKNRSRFWVSSRLAVMANLTLRGLLFKTEIDRHVFLIKVSVDSSPPARSISDSVKIMEIPENSGTQICVPNWVNSFTNWIIFQFLEPEPARAGQSQPEPARASKRQQETEKQRKSKKN